MAWHHKHFPTVHKFAEWYRQRDAFERFGINLVAWGGMVYFLYVVLFAPPIGFPNGAYVRIDEGTSLSTMAQTFEDNGIITSAWRFKLAVRLLGNDTKIPAGYYYFPTSENMVWIAMRILNGDFETTPLKVTIPEGYTNKDVAKLLVVKLPGFNAYDFLQRAREGYTFPDTYFFRPGDEAPTIIAVFDNNFRNKLQTAQDAITKSGHSLDEILTMASILEKEASKTADRKMIAGVLWHRIAIGMPLQVDAVFPYIIGKNTFQLTLTDLKVDSPYNTYIHTGLPPGPIDNPGLDSILAAAEPTKSNYIFFLSDKNGVFHYAKTYEEHMANRAKYLGN